MSKNLQASMFEVVTINEFSDHVTETKITYTDFHKAASKFKDHAETAEATAKLLSAQACSVCLWAICFGGKKPNAKEKRVLLAEKY